jgi:uncharacterized protein (DUF433 family)
VALSRTFAFYMVRLQVQTGAALVPERPTIYDVAMSNPIATSWQFLAPNLESSYKQLFIKGTRIRAEVIYGMTVDGSEPMTPEAVAADLGLPLAAVKEAIAYCEANPREIDEDHRGEERIMDATGMNRPDYKAGGKYRLLTPQERARLNL